MRNMEGVWCACVLCASFPPAGRQATRQLTPRCGRAARRRSHGEVCKKRVDRQQRFYRSMIMAHIEFVRHLRDMYGNEALPRPPTTALWPLCV